MSDKGKPKVLSEAKKRFQRCMDWESTAQKRSMGDVRFAMGDDENGWQWPDQYRLMRQQSNQPTLTINKARVHALQIINDARQNKSSVKIRAMGGGATYESAEAFDGVVRHIEYISNAQDAYNNAFWWQVMGGLGYWRILTDYASNDTLDQDIFIRRIPDPNTVFLDPDIQQADGSDARFAFIYENMPKDEFEATYPDVKLDAETLDISGWIGDDHVRVAEYYYRESETDTLYALADGSTALASEMETKPGKDDVLGSREITRWSVKWCKIAGDKIVEEADVPGSFIPIVRVVGEETVIDGQLDRRGHIRGLRDAQRMYNYYTSAYAEAIALQPKAPFIAPIQAISGLETYWNSANRVNHAFLPYNAVDEDGRPLPAPERAAPPNVNTAFIEGMKMAQSELMMASGQYQAVMGEQSNETSGVAIQQRQRQGDNATYHYIDRQAQAIRFTGKILIEWIPQVYDTKRLLMILAEDGEQSQLQVDPEAEQAIQQVPQEDGSTVRIFNPNVGRYEVEADIGPAYATRRQEAFAAFSQILSQNKEIFPIVGDLMFKAADFPMADEIAERLQRIVPPQAMGGPGPQQQQAAAQMQQAMQLIQQLQAKVAQMEQDKAREDFKAETDRLKAVGSIDPEAVKPVLREMVSQALGQPIMPIMAAHAQAEQAMRPPEPAPQPGAPAGPPQQ